MLRYSEPVYLSGQAGYLSGSGIPVDDVLRCGLINGRNGFFKGILGYFQVLCCYGRFDIFYKGLE